MSEASAVSAGDAGPTIALWDLLAHPVDPWAAAEALLGMSQGAAHMLAAILLVSSPEAEALLGAMHGLSRSLSIGTASRPSRSIGELRGPILWAETMAARAASLGDDNVFVYSVAAREYDTAENRVLVAALQALADAGRLVTSQGLRDRDTELARMLSTRAMMAIRWLEHRALVEVSGKRVSARDRQRTRTTARRRRYAVALDLLERNAEPLTAEDLALVADPRTKAQHRAVVALIEGLRRRNVAVPAMTVHQGVASAPPLIYVHDRSRRGRSSGGGIWLGDRVIDLPTIVDGQLVRVGASTGTPSNSPASETGPRHLLLSSEADVPAVLEAAGF